MKKKLVSFLTAIFAAVSLAGCVEMALVGGTLALSAGAAGLTYALSENGEKDTKKSAAKAPENENKATAQKVSDKKPAKATAKPAVLKK